MAVLQVNGGRGVVTGRLLGTTQAIPQYGAWGTGAGTTGATDTTLFTEASEARVAGTMTQQTTSTTNDTLQVVWTQTANGSKTITNAGLFDASSSGTLFMKGDFAGIALAVNDSITFTAKIQYT